MREFIPWSKQVLNNNIAAQKVHKMPVLDLELTAQCTGACCIYCDSKPSVGPCGHAHEINWSELSNIIAQSHKLGLKWIYTCGLGEPMEDPKFWEMLSFIKQNDINLSMFTNGVFIKDKYVAKCLKESNVHIVLKLDTFDSKQFDKILGARGTAEKIYAANEHLLSVGYGAQENNTTNLAYSIVPTYFSIEGIPKVIEFAEKNGVFASIGELENAGNVYRKDIKQILDVSPEQLDNLKNLADKYAGGAYKRPICSAIFTGIHIDNLGRCVVDRQSGLNCKWFLLNEPDVHITGDIRTDSIEELFAKVSSYRKQQFTINKTIFEGYRKGKFVFGGCGGNIQEVFEQAFELNVD